MDEIATLRDLKMKSPRHHMKMSIQISGEECMRGLVYLGVVGLALMSAADCAAKDKWAFEGSMGVGLLDFERYDSFEIGFIRGTVLYGTKFKFGLEGEFIHGLSTQREDGFYFENRTFVSEEKLSNAGSGFLVGRYETSDFGLHGRIGFRDIQIDGSITYDGERIVPRQTNAGAIELGLGGIYRFDKKRKHGLRIDVGTSFLSDQDEPSYYDGLGKGTIIQAAYSYKF